MDRFRRKLMKTCKKKGRIVGESVGLVVSKQYILDEKNKSEENRDEERFSIRRRTSDGELYSQRRQLRKKEAVHEASNLSLNADRPKTVSEIDSRCYYDVGEATYTRRSCQKYESGIEDTVARSPGERPRTLNDEELRDYLANKQRRKSTQSSKSWGGSLGRKDVRILVDGVPRGDSGDSDVEDQSKDNTDEDTTTDDDTDVTPTDVTSTDITPTDSREELFAKDCHQFSTVRRRYGLYGRSCRLRLSRFSKVLGVATQPVVSNAFSLPHINQLSDYEDDHVLHHDPPAENGHSHNDNTTTTSKPANKRSDKTKKTKLKRRRAYYRTPKDGRSKSLTHIDTLEDSNMLLSGEEMESREGATDKLGVPDPHSLRRRKLSLATKVSSCEYMVLLLECFVDPVEEFVQASRGTTLRDVLERRGVETTGIQVFPDGSRTPLPLNTDTYVLGGKTLRVRGRYQ
nr:uncharacterized protein LOC128697766 isoform X2 [Cherax quadricarinatus]